MHRVLFDRDVCVSYISCWRYSLLLHVSSATLADISCQRKNKPTSRGPALGFGHMSSKAITNCNVLGFHTELSTGTERGHCADNRCNSPQRG